MHTEYTLKFEFHTPTKQALTVFIQHIRAAAKELSVQAALLSDETPVVTLTIENNQIGIKQVKVFNGEDK